ncbi:MAG: hypothetical protein WBD36_01295 [Bacteroidota bacterium]
MKLDYLYRDAGNYKARGEVVFSNPDEITVQEATDRIRKACDSGCLFIADQVSLPEVFLFGKGDVTVDDHCFHEFDSLKQTEEPSTDIKARSLKLFVEQLEHESRRGWRAFDPAERVRQMR